MKKAILIIGAVVLAVVLAGGSFYGGMAFQRSQTQGRFLRGQNGAAGRGFGGGISGQVSSLNGNTMTLNTANNTFTVDLGSSTTVLKANSDTPSDLSQGEQVIVTGQRDSSGNFVASEVIILQKTAQ